MQSSHRFRLIGFCLAACLVAALLLISGAAQAQQWRELEKRNLVIIGDRVVDIAYNLGVYPVGMSVRCSMWPLCAKIKTLSQPLRCPGCLKRGRTQKLVNCIKKNQIKKVIIEKSSPFCLYLPDVSPSDSVGLLTKMGVDIQYVDMKPGIVSAIKRTASLLGKEKAGVELAARYQKSAAKLAKQTKDLNLAKRVVILNGVFQAKTGKAFVRVEAPGGYSDKFILEPLGCQNLGGALIPKGRKPHKGHVIIRKLKGLLQAEPDAIVITGDPAAVQKILAKQTAESPELGRIPVYSLPAYVDSSVIERPQIIAKWVWALK